MIRFDTDAVPVHRGHRNYFLFKENVHWVAVVVWALGWGPLKKIYLYLCVCVCFCLCLFVCLWIPGEGGTSLGDGVIGRYERPSCHRFWDYLEFSWVVALAD